MARRVLLVVFIVLEFVAHSAISAASIRGAKQQSAVKDSALHRVLKGKEDKGKKGKAKGSTAKATKTAKGGKNKGKTSGAKEAGGKSGGKNGGKSGKFLLGRAGADPDAVPGAENSACLRDSDCESGCCLVWRELVCKPPGAFNPTFMNCVGPVPIEGTNDDTSDDTGNPIAGNVGSRSNGVRTGTVHGEPIPEESLKPDFSRCGSDEECSSQCCYNGACISKEDGPAMCRNG